MDTAESRHLVTRINELEKELETLKVTSQNQIKESLSKYQRVIDATSEGFLELDPDFKIVDCNAAIEELLGKNKRTLLNQHVDSLYDKNSIFVHFASRDHLSFEANFSTSSGKSLRLLFKRSILRNTESRQSSYLVFFTDLTELNKAQEALKAAEVNYRKMYKHAVQGMYQCTLEGRFLRVNPAFAKIFGFKNTSELLDHRGGVNSLYKNPQDRQVLLSTLREHKIYTNYEVEMQRCDGKSIWVLINARLTEDAKGTPFIEGILIDNTDKRFAEEKLQISRERFRYLANHDGLTDLYNTRYLYKALDKLITKSKQNMEPFSLVFLDMDNFKHVVDTHGHLNGSQVLKEVAHTLQAGLPEPAFGVAYGGDEFVLVLPKTGKAGALEQIRMIRRIMKKTVYLENKGLQVKISASFGIATFPDDANDREDLLSLADEAMFRIKSRGKDAVGLAQH
ncbi:MAG: diguanylate cyclase [Desulfobacterales bacterium]|nr:diguanylate cyclase [Deltaproteobacteria bacterium]MBT8359812.1 diguanylate cyclase [Deltaproteobacteria bacterium]NNK96021.1 diguanylate cyclase [Desulfobacterales bacterium]